ncbi:MULTISPECIES: hypothetical protein [Methylomonas]|uniref:Uncharacterized protein n=2 Tax=Methylomonas TaxID=416 RepID=A0A140E3C1_9GAMM|nr:MULTISPECIES: hypothetical protein [Methylomonas]AMK74895.1 hypothetical protein JT25_000075 [Methylomonas denitrificans]OAH97358.1 hypothetical protein A1342_01075 [Methylomonas methanica]TCV81036.1 hypothetical protein EDE11_11785 [Methylomonas methanica]
MKYIVKQIADDFIFEEMELARKQFVEALNYTMESATIFFDRTSTNPLDFYIAYDFQQKHGDPVVYGFNLRDEMIRIFNLDDNKTHASKTALAISQQLKKLAEEIEERYDPEPTKTIAETQDKKDTQYASGINRSYRDVLREAIEQDRAEQLRKAESEASTPDDGYQRHTILLGSKSAAKS